MRLKDLFTVPTGQKVTEKALRRVLISSICSILLCMSCLVSTTWAWFAVSIENTGNVIQIATPGIKLFVDDIEKDSVPVGTRSVRIVHANELDDLQKKSTLYVTLTIQYKNGTTTVYTTLNQENQYETGFTIVAEESCTLSWEVSWFAPANAVALTENTITLTAEGVPVEETNGPTETTSEPTGESTEPSTELATNTTENPSPEAETEPSATDSTTAPSTEPSTVPSTEASANDEQAEE